MAFKGKSIIELTDVNTGEVEVHEDENMVTNALATVLSELMRGNIYNLFCYRDSLSNNVINRMSKITKLGIFPLYNYGIGGIFLFEQPQTENVNNIYPNGLTSLTGYASNHSNGVQLDKKLGSMDLTNSGPIENGYKFVWDFTTEQANGVISALALTTAAAGRVGLGSEYSLGSDTEIIKNGNSVTIPENLSCTFIPCLQSYLTSYSGNNSIFYQSVTDKFSSYGCIVKFDFENRIFISCRCVDTSVILVEYYKFYDDILDPNYDNNLNFKLLDSFEVHFEENLFSFSTSAGLSSTHSAIFEDASNDNIIWHFACAYNSNTKIMYYRWAKINLSEKTGTTGTFEFSSNYEIRVGETNYTAKSSSESSFRSYPYYKKFDNGFGWYDYIHSFSIVWHNKLFIYSMYGTNIEIYKISLDTFSIDAVYTMPSRVSSDDGKSNCNYFMLIKSSDILYCPQGYFDSEENFHYVNDGGGTIYLDNNNYVLFCRGRRFEHNGIIYCFNYMYTNGFGGATLQASFEKFIYTPMLHTINNLSSTVQKTVAKTMKITYTLTEVDEK